MGSQNILWTFTQCKTIKLHFYVFFRMVPCTFDWFILTFEYSLTKLPTLKKYNKWCILTCNYKISLILNGLDHSVVAKHNVTSSLLHVTQQLPIQIPPPQRIFFVCEKMKRTRKPWFFYKLFKTRVFSSSYDILKIKHLEHLDKTYHWTRVLNLSVKTCWITEFLKLVENHQTYLKKTLVNLNQADWQKMSHWSNSEKF